MVGKVSGMAILRQLAGRTMLSLPVSKALIVIYLRIVTAQSRLDKVDE
jgi:hypothetical protein